MLIRSNLAVLLFARDSHTTSVLCILSSSDDKRVSVETYKRCNFDQRILHEVHVNADIPCPVRLKGLKSNGAEERTNCFSLPATLFG